MSLRSSTNQTGGVTVDYAICKPTEPTMIKFVLLVNKQGQTRLSQYYEPVSIEDRVIREADIVRKCLSRGEEQVSAVGMHGDHP